MDLKTGLLSASSALRALIGLDDRADLHPTSKVLDLVHPADRQAIELQGAEAVMNQVQILGRLLVALIYLTLLCALSPSMTVAAIVVLGLAVLPVLRFMRHGQIIGKLPSGLVNVRRSSRW